ncbi:hypothetical protein HN803_04085 [candidate division WWE3 bacterium]|nr:hypothetical protein [candidate division WWE3 bacterium]
MESPSDTTGTNGRIPLGSTGGDTTHAFPSTVIKDGSTYKMWYSGNNGTNWRIFYATSSDGLTWTKNNNAIESASDTTGTAGRIPLGVTGADTSGAFDPTVIKDGSTYKMWYAGYDGSNYRILYATSSDGLTWTKHDNSVPANTDLLSTEGRVGLGTSGTGDDGNIYGLTVIKDGDLYRMWYGGSDGSDFRTYYATSLDGLNWSKVDNSTPAETDLSSSHGRIGLGSSGNADDEDIRYPAVINDNGTYKVWYSAEDGSNQRVSYATMQGLDTPTDPSRDVEFFEDEDESTTTNFTLLNSSVANGYAEKPITSQDLSNYDYITMWLMTTEAGNTVKLGFGETDATEQEQTFYINAANTWQKVYWDISRIPQNERDAVKRLRVTNSGTIFNYLYFDNIEANRYLNTSSGSTIQSTPNEYMQYRIVLTTTDPSYSPALHNVSFEWNNGYKIVQTDTNNVRLYNYSGETQNLRLEAIVFGADLAEWYTVDDSEVGPGDLVSLTGNLDDYDVPILKKTDKANDPNLLGAISTKAGQTLGIESSDRRLLALAGRVPINMDQDSNPIIAGDSITSGSYPGQAKKAAVGDRAIGRALEDWSPETGKKQLLILVAPGYTHGTEIIASKVGDIEEKVSTISTLLGLEGTDGSSDAILEGLTNAASEMTETFSAFQTYVDGLGLNVTEDAQGDALLAVNSDFAVTGSTSLADTTVTGNLNVGQVSINPIQNSIDVLGATCINNDIETHNKVLCDNQTLYLQKSQSGNVDLFDGAILIEPNGNITLKGIVDAEIIIADEYIVKSTAQTTGSSLLSAGQTETTIESEAVEDTSKIFITPTSKTEGQSLYIKGKIDGVSFTVAIDESVFEDINFDWWVLNVQE